MKLPVTFSVLLCVNKQQQWLSEAIESILSQDDQDFEFLIAANACTDELWSELQEFGVRDSRVRLFRSNVGQLSFNLNMLADQAHGNYLVRMDADDISEPDRLKILRRFLEQNEVAILGSAVTLIDERGDKFGEMKFPRTKREIIRLLPLRTVFCHPSVVINRQFLLSVRGYLGGFNSEDYDLWLRAVRSGANMGNHPEALLRYRVHSGQSTATRLGYAEVAGYWLRELFYAPSFYNLYGFLIGLCKAIFARILPGERAYRD